MLIDGTEREKDMKKQCTSCGGEYENTEKMCPYCGTENKEAAGREMKHILGSYDAEAKEMETTVPKKHLKRWSRSLLAVVLIILIVLVVGTVAAVIKGQVDSAVEAGRGNKALTQLEAYYEAEDYDAMREYCRKNDLYGYEYDKYWEVMDADRNIGYCTEDIENYEKYGNRDFLDNFTEQIWIYGTLAYKKGYEAVNDRNFLGNEDRIEALLSGFSDTLKEHGFTDEMIELLKTGNEEDKELFQNKARENF